MRRPKARRLSVPRTRAGQRRTVQVVMSLCVPALLPATWMFVAAGDRLREVSDAPRTDVAVVFGAGLGAGNRLTGVGNCSPVSAYESELARSCDGRLLGLRRPGLIGLT